MKQYLTGFFKYNDWANRKTLEAIKQMPNPEEAIKLFSHMAFSLNKWLNRITKEQPDSALSWQGEPLPIGQLELFWSESLKKWLEFLDRIPLKDLEKDIEFNRPADGKKMAAKLLDVALQINYHQIHHRAQIVRIIRQQGQTPPATDYIFTVMKES